MEKKERRPKGGEKPPTPKGDSSCYGLLGLLSIGKKAQRTNAIKEAISLAVWRT